ncbi:hypothetical protein ASF58_08235 [Methylobacterium sp. Leaf125]|jgi:hypothetical protein|uniref:hypothetical protein n=1 Tax=unclassified Methylobacterium TaxID=2615210 RepID=UPI0006FB1203|nr:MULTISPECIES: hypothetical protein [unclassified Methylobacterium]KQQ40934.1 hypothetical protein ASF58_08235 [Methylobacterium sp. Leaf125]POR43479.1 hypothetical protein CRT23_08275 [Methylobacterium sp. V23]
MGSVPATMDNVVPFRRTLRPQPSAAASAAPRGGLAARRSEQRALMDSVYATGSLSVAAGDRETKLIAARLQVYGFVLIEEIGADGRPRRLRPSEAIRARTESPWRLSKASYGAAAGLAVTIPAVDDFLFDQPADRPA